LGNDLYALIALAARYWFVALMAALLFRGWRMTVSDNRRAKLLREWMGQTGCVGEFIANPGAKKRVSYPIPREGVLGSARSADVRIRHRDLARAHAHFELREGGLLVKPLGSAQLMVGGGHTGEAVFLQDGDVLSIGRLQLMLVLFDVPIGEEEEPDEWFEVGQESGEADEGTDEAYDGYPAAGYAEQYSEEDDSRTAKRRARVVPVGTDAPLKTPAPRRGSAVSKRAGMFDNPLEKQVQTAPPHASLRIRKQRTGGRTKPDGAEAWFDEPPAAGRASKTRTGTAGKRAKPARKDDFFHEDEIWRNQ
jgi:predicted component of type VI protein secretion system